MDRLVCRKLYYLLVLVLFAIKTLQLTGLRFKITTFLESFCCKNTLNIYYYSYINLLCNVGLGHQHLSHLNTQ